MLKKLRRRFILIMMAMVAVVLAVTFSVLVISSAQRFEQDSERSLSEGFLRLSPSVGTVPNDWPDMPAGEVKMPFDGHASSASFYVTLDSSGDIVRIDDFTSSVDLEDVQAAVDAAAGQGALQGTVGSMGLRYQVFESAAGETVIGFVDISFEQSFIRDQVLYYSLIGIGSLAAFFIISLILSKLAIRPVERAWKKQQQFVADASHELKTPITIMLANTSILLEDKQLRDAESGKWLSHIDQEARHMKKLVEDLLFLARVDAKDNRATMTMTDLSDTAYQSVLPFEPVLFEAGMTLAADIEPGVRVVADPGQIKQLISILLDNARKYAQPRSQIDFRLKKESGKAVMTVHNAGEPIGPQDLAHLFDRFYRADQARTRSANSYGLGLSIAKEIVDMHKGRISAASSAAEGTVFTVILPLAG